MRKTLISVLAVAFLLAALLIPISSHIYINYFKHEEDWKLRTSPLPQETIDTLCSNFNLESNNSLCIQAYAVYGPDFYEIIRDTFRPYEAYRISNTEAATYEQVEEKIGKFKVECESVVHQADGFSYFNCIYDLRGDREFIIGIMYSYPDDAVFRINTPMGFDGE